MAINIEEKLLVTVRTLSKWRTYKKIFPLTCKYKKIDKQNRNIPTSLDGFLSFDYPHLIFENNTYFWFHSHFKTDKLEKDQKVYLSFEMFMPINSGSTRPQGLVYLNGNLVQSIDINHQEVLIEGDKEYDMYLLLFTHEFSISLPFFVSLKYNYSLIEDSYYDFNCIADGLSILKVDSEEYKNALPIINNALNIIDYRKQYSCEFFDSLKKARDYIRSEYFNKYCGKNDRYINCIGHSHIDVAWLWDYDQTRQKVQRTFSTMLKLMDEYPEFKYFHTTPQVFEFLKEDNIELFNKVKQKIKEGRFEVDGASWLECDCNIPSGESLVRQLMFGQRFFQKEFGVKSTTLVLPDVFGYSSQLPQLLVKSGINRFLTAKIGWNDTNRFPYDSFDWYGLDNSHVFSYLISCCDANPRLGIENTTYTSYVGRILARQIYGTWSRYQNKDENTTTITTYGWGDGGGGPTSGMIESIKRFSYGLPSLGKTRISTLRESLDEIEHNFRENCLKNNKKIKWNGELYFEYHRGTYTSVPRIKYYNRTAENLLQTSEILSSLIDMKHYPNIELHTNWKILLLNQFHDVIPGSSIEKVYQDADAMFEKLFNSVNKIIDNKMELLSTSINSKDQYVLFNPTPFKGVANVSVDGEDYIVEDVPSFGYKTFNPTSIKNDFVCKDQYFENEYISICFDDYGNIISLFDKEQKKEYVKYGCKFNELVTFEDMPFQYDNWELTPYHKQKMYHFEQKASFKIEKHQNKVTFIITRLYFDSEVIQKVTLYTHLKKVEINTHVTWKEKRQVLKVLFPLNIISDVALYETQFGYNKRNTIPQNSFDDAKFEVCGHRFVFICDNKNGFGLINNGKYGYSCDKDILSMSVAKSGGYPYNDASLVIPDFTYSFILGDNNSLDNVIKEAYLLNRPLLVKKIKGNGSLLENNSFFNINSKGVYIDTIKKCEDGNGYIVRIYEGLGEKHDFNITSSIKISSVKEVNLLEEEVYKTIAIKDNIISLSINPFEVITLMID